jgi:hypothetical protein
MGLGPFEHGDCRVGITPADLFRTRNVSDLSGPRERCGKKDAEGEDAGEPTQRLAALVKKGCSEYRRLLAFTAVKPVAWRIAGPGAGPRS